MHSALDEAEGAAELQTAAVELAERHAGSVVLPALDRLFGRHSLHTPCAPWPLCLAFRLRQIC